MKKFILALCFALLFCFAGQVGAATEDISPFFAEPVDSTNLEVIYAYNLDTNVTQGVDQVFKFEVPDEGGWILEFAITTASTKYHAWVSVTEDAERLDLDKTILSVTNVNLSISPAIVPERRYLNRDAPVTNVLYLTLSAQDTVDTGVLGQMTITFKRSI